MHSLSNPYIVAGVHSINKVAMSEPPEQTSPKPGFTRGGFAPIPHRHSDIAPLPSTTSPTPALALSPSRVEWERGRGKERELPRRELDPEPEDRERRREWDEYPPRRESRGHWEDDFDRPKRRRSPSPLGPSHRPRLNSPSPPPPRFNIPDPASIETLLPFRTFAEWFRTSHPQTARADEEETRKHKEMIESGQATEQEAKEKVGMAKRYERYRKEFTSRQLYALFLTHRDSAWFKEKYLHFPEYAALRRRLNRQGRIPQVGQYISELRSGAHDQVSYDQIEDVPGVKLDEDEPEGLNRALGDKGEWGEDGAVRVELAPRTKQVFVKTVPPNCSRKALEDLFSKVPGFQWLAISDPSQKRSFHRVAWAQYADDTDVSKVIEQLDSTKIEGFTFHLTINTTPTIGRVRIAPPSVSTLDRLLLDGTRAKSLALKLEEELLGDDEESVVEGEGGEKAKPAEGDVKVEGEAAEEKPEVTKSLGLREKGSDVVEEVIMKLVDERGLTGEDLDEEQKVQKAKIILDQWIAYLRHGLSTCYYCIAPCAFMEELQRKCIAHVRAHPSSSTAEHHQEQEHEHEHEHEHDTEEHARTEVEDVVKSEVVDGAGDGTDVKAGVQVGKEEEKEADGEEVEKEVNDEDREMREDGQDNSKTVLTAHPSHAAANDRSDRERERKSRKNTFPQKTAEEKWIESHDLRIAPLLISSAALNLSEEKDGLRVGDYGGRDPEEELKKLCAPLIKQEEQSKYRCKECNKLFRAPEFVIKHITTKHTDVTQGRIDDVLYLNNFVLDPQHIQPSVSTLAAINDKLPASSSNPLNPSLPSSLPLNPFDPSVTGAAFSHSQMNGMSGMPMSMGMGMNPGGGHGTPGGQGHGQFNLMQQQMMMMLQMQQAMMMGQMGMGMGGGGMGGGVNASPMAGGAGAGAGGVGGGAMSTPTRGGGVGGQLAGRMGGYAPSPANLAPLPPPPPGGEDPRARRGRVSYQDLDEPGAGGGGGLPY
ncbi:arsenite-resistant protein ASR2 [Cryptococcus neoformans]|nr:arsenite-resistant protein ASR2 [Cryptococcus neoformans var. grubii Th84]OXH13046.1 arsenite-resistant protein ASR2 [Cryptococcus neoformans var. grubii]OXH33826.1 arsenite-resistant protein ASR2 [Cryptococcus neoformans var. grubii]OXH54345.1 arsenite-resistant protein ASR2 [Cryptococcus neoformans var. grubii]OXH58062.1 arsenite-resistant protein ASR2 [Cryptococcus neoformans var. grubii]